MSSGTEARDVKSLGGSSQDMKAPAIVGFISPLDLIDTIPYEFSQIAGPQVMLATISLGLESFDGAHIRERLDVHLERCLSALVARSARVIMLSGIPIMVRMGPSFYRHFGVSVEERFRVRACTDMEGALAALKELGARRIAVANKWDRTLNDELVGCLKEEGFEIATLVAKAHSARDLGGPIEDGMRLACELARRARSEASRADAIYLVGGAWLTIPLIQRLEDELGCPVVTGLQSAIWYALKMAGLWHPVPQLGRLLSMP